MSLLQKNPKNSEHKKASFPVCGKSVSTVLIPDRMMSKFTRHSRRYKSKGKYFSYLFSRFRVLLEYYVLNPAALKTVYQENDQALHKVNIRIENEDWAELGVFSVSTGRSRCLLFVILLWMDFQNWGTLLKKIGIQFNHPFSVHRKWELISFIGLDRDGHLFFRGFYAVRYHRTE